jgi:hypothetical protein
MVEKESLLDVNWWCKFSPVRLVNRYSARFDPKPHLVCNFCLSLFWQSIHAHICRRQLCAKIEFSNTRTQLRHQSLESITKWLRGSGLFVNQNKTELCLFFKWDVAPSTTNPVIIEPWWLSGLVL